MRNVKAIISLAPGEVGFFDDLSRVHLTISRPKAQIYEHTNTEGLIRGVRARKIRLEAGSLIPSSKEKYMKEEEIIKPVAPAEVPQQVVEEIEIKEDKVKKTKAKAKSKE